MRWNMAEVLARPIRDPEWIVEGVLPRGSFGILAGEAGAGKTTLCYHLALCLVAKLPFLGSYPTHQTRVLYIDEENGTPDAERYWQRIYQGLGAPDTRDFHNWLCYEHFSVSTKWEKSLTSLAADFHPGLIIIDTATPALQIIDENDNGEASHRIQTLRHIQQVANNNASLLVLKHEKIRDDVSHRRTVRGAKTWLGAADIVMFHSFGRGGSGALRHTFLRADKPRAFGLDHVVEIIPSWTSKEEPRGYRLQCARAKGVDE